MKRQDFTDFFAICAYQGLPRDMDGLLVTELDLNLQQQIKDKWCFQVSFVWRTTNLVVKHGVATAKLSGPFVLTMRYIKTLCPAAQKFRQQQLSRRVDWVEVFYYPGQKKEPSSRFAARRTLFHVWYHTRSGAMSAGQVRSATVRDFCPALIAPDRAWYHTWNSVLLAANLEDGSFFWPG